MGHPRFSVIQGQFYCGTTGKTSALGWALSCRMVFVAFTIVVSVLASLPVFRLRSKRGKLLLLTSRRIMWPFKNTLLVDHISILYSRGWPGVMNAGAPVVDSR